MGWTSTGGQRFLHLWRLQCGAGVAVDDLGTYKEHFIARIFLMRTVCQVVLSGSHPSLTFHAFALVKMKLCAFSKTVHTSCNMSYITPEWTSTFPPCTRTPSYPSARPTSTSSTFHSIEINPATIQNKRVLAVWLMYAPLQVMSPRILQKTMDLCIKPLFFHRTEKNFD